MGYELLTFQVADRIATITVNRPDKLNALNDALMAELGRAIDDAVSRDDVGAVLLTGAGRAFVAGADIAELAHQRVVQRVQLVRPIHRDRGDAVGDLERQKLVVHCQISYIPGPRFALNGTT